jgi:hypothetical protein
MLTNIKFLKKNKLKPNIIVNQSLEKWQNFSMFNMHLCSSLFIFSLKKEKEKVLVN